MILAKSMEIRENFKAWCIKASEGEVVQIARPGNNFVYLISRETYEKLTAGRRMAAYTSYLYGKDKITNLKRISEIEKMPENWNNNGAEPIPAKLIKIVRKLIMSLEFQPEVFPTASDAIQLEWQNQHDEYLEMEIMEDSINIFRIDPEGGENQFTIAVDDALVKKVVKDFYDRVV